MYITTYIGGDHWGSVKVDEDLYPHLCSTQISGDNSVTSIIDRGMEDFKDFCNAGGYGGFEVTLEDDEGEILRQLAYAHSAEKGGKLLLGRGTAHTEVAV